MLHIGTLPLVLRVSLGGDGGSLSEGKLEIVTLERSVSRIELVLKRREAHMNG